MPDLFQAAGLDSQNARPLADRLRPNTLAEVVGQDHLLGPNGPIGRMIGAHRISSMVLWGPPGVGKTTIARLLADAAGYQFQQLSAVFSGVADLRKAFETARTRRAAGQTTLLFIDEIHRFNRAQQDGFLPYAEDGTVVLVGATTENPSFELNAALLSRAQVLVLRRLDDVALETLLGRAEGLEGRKLPLDPSARAALKAMADGDGRFVLNLAEQIFAAAIEGEIDASALASIVQRRALVYDKDREEHYNLISALHKSMRGSDPDAALYWLARMLAGGEEPLYIVRRLVRFAVEDVGAADPDALLQALAAKDAYDFLGTPEGELAIAQAVVFLSTAPKSNAIYRAFSEARAAAEETGSLMPPKHILNAPTGLMKNLGYGQNYEYDHEAEDSFSGQNYFPETMDPRVFYRPTSHGFEAQLQERLERWAQLRSRRVSKPE